METLKEFKCTQMYNTILKSYKFLNLSLDKLATFEKSTPFWISDEKSYDCFLSVLKDEFDLVKKCHRPTRRNTLLLRLALDECMEMLLEYSPDDLNESINDQCVICLYNAPSVLLKCGHSVVCKKCFRILKARRVTACVICRRETNYIFR